MEISKENLRQLIRLQERDRVLDSLQSSIDRIPIDVKSLSAALEAEKSRLAEAKNNSTRLQLAKKEKEISLAQKEDAIRKHGTELNSVKTNEAYKALQNEIEKAKAEVGDLETAVLTLMEEIDQSARAEKTASAELKDKEVKIQNEIKTLEAKKTDLTAKAESEKSKRAALVAGVPAGAFKLYEYLHKRMRGIAMSPIKGNMCGICRITLRPQSIIDLARGTQLVTCEACQRIIYDPKTLAAESSANGQASAQPVPSAAPAEPAAGPAQTPPADASNPATDAEIPTETEAPAEKTESGS